MHEATDNEATGSAAGQVQSRTLLHTSMSHQPPLGEKICRQLDGAAEAGSDHCRTNTAVQAAHTLRTVDLRQAIPSIAILVLSADWQKRRIALKAGLDEEERTAGSCANDAREGTAKHVDSEVLGIFVVEEQGC